MLLAAIQQREVDERAALSEADVVGIVEKLIKQRRDSISQYDKGGRGDLANAERFEVDVLSQYLPRQVCGSELDEAVNAAIARAGASGPQDMGKVMAVLKAELRGRADMATISALVKAKLAV